MVGRRAATPGSLWANISSQGPASSFSILTVMQKVHTEVEFKTVLSRRENVGFFIAEEPKRRLLDRGQGAGGRGQESFSKDTWRSPSASAPMILKIRSPLMLSVTEPRTRIWTQNLAVQNGQAGSEARLDHCDRWFQFQWRC